jgi:hypothetical protein
MINVSLNKDLLFCKKGIYFVIWICIFIFKNESIFNQLNYKMANKNLIYLGLKGKLHKDFIIYK